MIAFYVRVSIAAICYIRQLMLLPASASSVLLVDYIAINLFLHSAELSVKRFGCQVVHMLHTYVTYVLYVRWQPYETDAE